MLLEQLSNEIGVSGNEGAIRKIIIPAIKEHVDDIVVDTIGNVYAYKSAGAIDSSPTVMITAHMDEVGFMITKVTDKGMLKFTTVGGFDPRILLGKSVLVGPEKIPGVIGTEAIHNVPAHQRNTVTTLNGMAIDIGASSKDAASAKVSLGDYASFDTRYGLLNGESEKMDAGVVKGKALDNRAGCAMLVEILKASYPVNIVGVFTVQEEIGLRGATIAAHKADPDMAIILECTTADDLPIKDQEISYPRLGDGPCLTVMDRSFIANRQFLDHLETTAKKHDIPFQYKKPSMGGTDAGAIHQSRIGIPSVTVSAPSRYIHSPVALMELADFWNCIKLVKAAVSDLSQSFSI